MIEVFTLFLSPYIIFSLWITHGLNSPYQIVVIGSITFDIFWLIVSISSQIEATNVCRDSRPIVLNYVRTRRWMEGNQTYVEYSKDYKVAHLTFRVVFPKDEPVSCTFNFYFSFDRVMQVRRKYAHEKTALRVQPILTQLFRPQLVHLST